MGAARLEQSVRVYPNLEEAQRMRIYLIRSRQIELEKRLKRQRGYGREFEKSARISRWRRIPRYLLERHGPARQAHHEDYQVERSQTMWLVLDACGCYARAWVS